MITDVGEIRAIRTMLDECGAKQGYLEPIALDHDRDPSVSSDGDRIAREADFLSVEPTI